jgi:hypothetical protein
MLVVAELKLPAPGVGLRHVVVDRGLRFGDREIAGPDRDEGEERDRDSWRRRSRGAGARRCSIGHCAPVLRSREAPRESGEGRLAPPYHPRPRAEQRRAMRRRDTREEAPLSGETQRFQTVAGDESVFGRGSRAARASGEGRTVARRTTTEAGLATARARDANGAPRWPSLAGEWKHADRRGRRGDEAMKGPAPRQRRRMPTYAVSPSFAGASVGSPITGPARPPHRPSGDTAIPPHLRQG